MKLAPERLKESLGKQILPVYIVSGDEPLLIQEACDVIRGALRDRGYDQRDLFHAEGRFDWKEVLFSANSMFFSNVCRAPKVSPFFPISRAGVGRSMLARYWPFSSVTVTQSYSVPNLSKRSLRAFCIIVSMRWGAKTD